MKRGPIHSQIHNVAEPEVGVRSVASLGREGVQEVQEVHPSQIRFGGESLVNLNHQKYTLS